MAKIMNFTLETRDSETKARAGLLETDHGTIQTPIFMPVGTIGSVKGVHQHELEEQVKAQIILGNTYHLYLRPKTEILEKVGGLHKFIGWDKPILTDSGGFQVYSLSQMRKLTEKGVTFQSHIDGSKHLFTPERAIDIQRQIGGDIIMAFDECTPYPCDYKYAKKSLALTHRWLKRCCVHFDKQPPLYDYTQSFFPIVQGSTYKDLRKDSAKVIRDFDREGNAIGTTGGTNLVGSCRLPGTRYYCVRTVSILCDYGAARPLVLQPEPSTSFSENSKTRLL